jgi:hypothetical protein
MRPGVLLRKVRTLLHMPPRRRWLLLEAAWSLLIVRLWLASVPVDRVAGRLGVFVPPTDRRVIERQARCYAGDAAIAMAVRWAIERVAPHMPFRAVCLQRAMAAHAMLRRRGVPSVLHFGAAKQREKALDAHAWLDAAGVPVTGYPLDPGLTELGCLV